MTILNLMLGRGHGGLEQASVDYAEALALAGYETLTVTSPGAWASSALADLPQVALPHWSVYDPFAIRRLRRLAVEQRATTVICHGNRALRLALAALKGRLPIVATAHNYSVKRFAAADRVLCITHDLMDEMSRRGYPGNRVFHMPNMVRIPGQATRPADRRIRPVISAMGRFVEKKGFDVFIDAVRILRQRGVDFQAILGGDGEVNESLRKRAVGLEDTLTFAGWVTDKSTFFNSSDIFVLPSRHEPFGIVLLEAMAHGVPVVTTDTEGPREIVKPGRDALLVPRDNAAALADAIESLLVDHAQASALAAEAYLTASCGYGVRAMSERLKQLLTGDMKLVAIAHPGFAALQQ